MLLSAGVHGLNPHPYTGFLHPHHLHPHCSLPHLLQRQFQLPISTNFPWFNWVLYWSLDWICLSSRSQSNRDSSSRALESSTRSLYNLYSSCWSLDSSTSALDTSTSSSSSTTKWISGSDMNVDWFNLMPQYGW